MSTSVCLNGRILSWVKGTYSIATVYMVQLIIIQLCSLLCLRPLSISNGSLDAEVLCSCSEKLY